MIELRLHVEYIKIDLAEPNFILIYFNANVIQAIFFSKFDSWSQLFGLTTIAHYLCTFFRLYFLLTPFFAFNEQNNLAKRQKSKIFKTKCSCPLKADRLIGSIILN